MSDDIQEAQDGFSIAGVTLEKAAFGGALIAMVVFGIFKDLLG
jgi:hypothetical protein